MPNFEKLYYDLFGAAADATVAIEGQNYGEALSRLIQAQQDCEETVISEGEERED